MPKPVKIHGRQNRFRSRDLEIQSQWSKNEKSSTLATWNVSKHRLGSKPSPASILSSEYSTCHQCKCVQKMWVATLFWIYSKIRSQTVSRVIPRLEIDRLGVFEQVSNQIYMRIWRSIGWSKSTLKIEYFQILKDLCYFWLDIAKYDFFKSSFSNVNFGLIQKVANKLFVNLMVLNKFLLCYVGSKSIFRKIASQNSASEKWLVSFPWINKLNRTRNLKPKFDYMLF